MLKQCLVFSLAIFGLQYAHAENFHFCLENQHVAPFLLGTGALIEGQNGIVPDMLIRASKNLDNTITFERKPWKRCQAELAQGGIDAIAAFIFNEERDGWSAFPKTNGVLDDRFFYQSDYIIFTHPDSALSWDGNVLLPAGANVQSSPGYIADKKLQAMGFMPIAQLQARKALPLVASQVLDGFIIDAVIGRTLINELGLEGKVIPLEIPFMSQQWYAAFSKATYTQRPDQVEAFWTALKAVRIKDTEALFKHYEQPITY